MRASVPLALPLVLCGFAANSLLCRAVLGPGDADAATFTAVRLGSGAIALALLARGRGELWHRPRLGPSLALAVYAFAFSWAYRSVPAGTGALLLFGAVQVTMLAVARVQGGPFPWTRTFGAVLAFGGLLVLSAPSATAPPWQGALAMLLAGIAWGAYSLLGRGSTVPVADSAAAFLGAALLVLPTFLLPASHHATPKALLLAALSGTVASGATYALWYALLPRLGAFRAAVAQLAVPLIAAAGAAALLREWPSPVWFAAAALILSGLGLALGKAPTATPAPAPPRA
ncbi:MAG: DMT family transporter [Holophagaceae bacterium]